MVNDWWMAHRLEFYGWLIALGVYAVVTLAWWLFFRKDKDQT